MIRVTDILNKTIDYNVTYYRKSQALDIEAIPPCEKFNPFRESINCVLLLDEDRVLCEVEYIFPDEIETRGLYMNDAVKTITGTPALNVEYDDNPVELYFSEERVALVLEKEKHADSKIISSNLVYFLAGDQVTAISCKNYKLV